MNALLFDIGGTRTRVTISRDGQTFRAPIIYPTPKTFASGMHHLRRAGLALAAGKKITAIAGGIAGPLNTAKTKTIFAANLPGWKMQPLAAQLRTMWQAPVQIENDAALGALGEATRGAGRGKHVVAFLNVGTGVGGARVVNGRIDAAAHGFEPGHQIIEASEHLLLENIVSGRAVERQWKKKPWTINSRRVWTELSAALGIGLVNMTVLWSPDIIILGGSMFRQPGLLVPVAAKTLRRYVSVFPTTPKVVAGRLGVWAGLYGALELVHPTVKT